MIFTNEKYRMNFNERGVRYSKFLKDLKKKFGVSDADILLIHEKARQLGGEKYEKTVALSVMKGYMERIIRSRK